MWLVNAAAPSAVQMVPAMTNQDALKDLFICANCLTREGYSFGVVAIPREDPESIPTLLIRAWFCQHSRTAVFIGRERAGMVKHDVTEERWQYIVENGIAIAQKIADEVSPPDEPSAD